jgi:MFS family permease
MTATTEIPNDRRRWLALLLVCAAQLMIVLDGTIVNVALPAIQDSLGFSQAGLSWVVNAYLLTFGGFLLLGGRAGDLFGRRRVFAFGLALFPRRSRSSSPPSRIPARGRGRWASGRSSSPAEPP